MLEECSVNRNINIIINTDEHNTVFTCIPKCLYLVLYIHLNKQISNGLFILILIKSVPVCEDYIRIRVHIHNYSDTILCATCYNRPPVLSDRFCWAGRAVAKDWFYFSNFFSNMVRHAYMKVLLRLLCYNLLQ